MGECMGSELVGQPRNRWIDSDYDYMKKKRFEVGQTKRKVHDMNK